MNLRDSFVKDGIAFDESVFENIDRYKTLLFKWNRVHNLTGIKDEKQLDEFIHDAIYPITFLPKIKNLLDIGTGAGFPGMMLAIAMSDVEVTLVEPIVKRASFLQFVKADLELDNVNVKNSRIQELESELFDIVTSRAVTDTKLLIELSKPFCHSDTQLLFYKGENVYNEVDKSMDYEIIKAQKRHYLLLKGFDAK